MSERPNDRCPVNGRVQKFYGVCDACCVPTRTRKSKHCWSCHLLHGTHGRAPIPMPPCMDCGSLVSERKYKRCKSCYTAHMRKNPRNKITDPEAHFWSLVEKQELVTSPHVDTPCWIFVGPKVVGKWGYGNFAPGARIGTGRHAHRYAYFLKHGPIPKGVQILHHCDNPPCVKDDHLFPGTNNDNRQDSVYKGRSALGNRNGSRTHPERLHRGDSHPMAKLNHGTVVEIRRLCLEQGHKQSVVAAMFGVSQSNVSHIMRGKTWKHVS